MQKIKAKAIHEFLIKIFREIGEKQFMRNTIVDQEIRVAKTVTYKIRCRSSLLHGTDKYPPVVSRRESVLHFAQLSLADRNHC